MIKTSLAVPSAEEELEILMNHGSDDKCRVDDLNAITNLDEILKAKLR